ncbi:hypothetical protein JL721_11644 [Aureococcus anophagefferens]|nr:hypothetical protein JL721_11644 [Aureococcus anophagefferens]
MAKKLPGPGDGELFWRWLVIYPAALAVIASETSGLVSGVPRASRDPLALPHAFVAACFGLASLQPSRFLPAALILGCTFATRPNSIPTAMPAFVAAISAGALSAGAVRFLFVKAPKKKKKAVASKDD